MFSGILNSSILFDVVTLLIMTHLTVLGVTIYLHRCQAHRSLELHPIISHFFRMWLWLTTGMLTKEWVPFTVNITPIVKQKTTHTAQLPTGL